MFGDQPWDRTTFSRASAECYDHTSSLVGMEPTAGVAGDRPDSNRDLEGHDLPCWRYTTATREGEPSRLAAFDEWSPVRESNPHVRFVGPPSFL